MKKTMQKQLFEDKGYLCDMLKLMSIEEESELKSISNIPTLANNDVTRDKTVITEKSEKEKKKKTST